MKKEYKDFIEANQAFFQQNSGVNRDVVVRAYEIYNDVFNQNKKPSGCYRCWKTVKEELYQKYLQDNV